MATATTDERSTTWHGSTPIGRARWLLADAAMSGTSGVVLIAAAGLLDGPFGIGWRLLVALGLVFVGYAATLFALARIGAPARGLRAVAAVNLAWAGVSWLALATDVIEPTSLGQVVTTVQAIVVAGFGIGQWRAARP